MVKEVRIYVEGGGDGKNTRIEFRQGFSAFLRTLIEAGRSKRIKWRIVPCGPRHEAYHDFINSLKENPQSLNILLVDSEGPVDQSPWEHLQHDGLPRPKDAADDSCHLMVQIMEAWFVADVQALQTFYGQKFNAKAIPRNRNVEEIDKATLEGALEAATKHTQKASYHKSRHAPKLLEKIDAEKVRQAAPHCDRLFTTLAGVV